jgi:phage repressor protein C with HTH and peptisase S24 domain
VRASAGSGALTSGERAGPYLAFEERADDVLVVKRLAVDPTGQRVTIQSDNPAYPDWPDCDIDSIHGIGRVIWAGRRLG